MMEKLNHLHSCLQNVIERAFHVLKMKCHILLLIPHFNDSLPQTKIITACMCSHNFIRDNNLHEQFDRFERCAYVREDSASCTGGPALSSSDSVMVHYSRASLKELEKFLLW